MCYPLFFGESAEPSIKKDPPEISSGGSFVLILYSTSVTGDSQ